MRIEGRSTEYVRVSDEPDRAEHTFSFCPECGATVYYRSSHQPDRIAVPIGAFADPEFPPPTVSVYEWRRHAWVSMPDTVVRDDEPGQATTRAGASAPDEVTDLPR